MWLAHIVKGVSHANEGLNLCRTVLQSLFVVLDGVLEVASFEEQVAHGDQAKHVFRVQVDTLLEVLGGDFEVALLEVENTQLAECLVVVRVFADAEFVVLFRNFRVLRQEVKGLSVPEVGRNALWVQFACVFEVLDGLGILSQFSEECGVVQTGPEVLFVHLEACL